MPSDQSPQAWFEDLRAGLALMTRLPVRRPQGESARAVRSYPLVGVVVGACGAVGYWLADGLSLPPLACAFIALVATVLLTGGFHEDGLADVADGLGGGRDRADKLAIMRDPRIGSFGVLALLLSLGLRAAALSALASSAAVAAALIAAHALSRALLPALMRLLPLAREQGLAVAIGRPERRDIWTALALGAAVAWLMEGFGGALLLLLVAITAAAVVGLLARAQIGGYTGDILGAAQQAGETAALLAVTALA